ncbi:MAG: PAS domain S-box protein [Pseudomonadota bacterium]
MSSTSSIQPPPSHLMAAAADDFKFKACLEAAVDAIVVIDAAGNIEEFNPAATRMFGYSLDEVVGRNVSVLMASHDASRHDDYMSNYEATGEARIIGTGREVKAQRRDGQTFPVKLSVGKATMPDGTRYVGIIHDLSHQQAAARALKRSEAALRSAQEIARIGTFDVALPTRGDQIHSTQLLKILGLPVSLGDGVAELMFRELVHPDDVGRLDKALKVAAAGRQYADIEYRIERPSGEVRSVRVMATVSPMPGVPKGLRLTGALHDITDARRAEEEARQARERLTQVGRLSTLGEMASGLAHELNQPLTAIAAYSQAAKRMPSVEGSDVGQALENITMQALRAGDVISRMREMVRHGETKREATDCNQLVRELITLAEPDARAADIGLRLDLCSPLPLVNVDRVQIQQVLLNLVRNAIDAMPGAAPGAEIEIRTRLSEARDVEVAVIDGGSGLPEDALEQLCTPFFTTKQEGTGLGLAISQSIIRAHGGALRFANNISGCGATVSFSLPAVAEEGDQDQ